MQKIGYRLRNILLLAILILVAGAAASIAEDQLSPEGPRVIGQIFGMEAQAADFEYDLADYDGKDLAITITEKGQRVTLTQSNNETPVSVNITITWDAPYTGSEIASSGVTLDSINIGSGSIKVLKGSSLTASDRRFSFSVMGHNTIKNASDDYVVSVDKSIDFFYFGNASTSYDKGLTIINTKDPDKGLSVGSLNLSNPYAAYLNLSGLDKKAQLWIDNWRMLQLSAPQELKGYQEIKSILVDNSETRVSNVLHINEDGKATVFVYNSSAFPQIKNDSMIVINLKNGASIKGTAHDVLETSDGYKIPRASTEMKLAPPSPKVIKISAYSMSIDTINGQSYYLYDAEGKLIKTEQGTGEPLTFSLNNKKTYSVVTKITNPESGWDAESAPSYIMAFDFKDKALNNGTYNQVYSGTVSQDSGFTYKVALNDRLPTGLSLDRNTGEVKGTPTVPGSYSFKIEATPIDSTITFSPGTATFTLTVNKGEQTDIPDAPVLDNFTGTGVALKVKKGVEYQCYEGQTLKTSKTASADGTLIFSDLTAGKSYSFSARLPQSAYLNPGPSSPSILVKPFDFTPSPANGVYQSEYSQKVAATPAGNYQYTLVEGMLPEGLSLAADGTISGKSTKAGSYNLKIKAAATDAGLVAGNSITKDATITIDPAKPQTPAAPTVKADTVGINAASLNANAVPDAGTIAALANAPYEYAVSSVNGQDVGTPVWQDSTDFTGLAQGSSYTFAARFKATDNTTASDASAWSDAVTTKVTVKVPAIALEDDSPCATEGQACQINADVTHKGETPADAVLNVGDAVTYTITPCAEHSFRSLSINNTTLTEEQLSVDKGVVTATYTVKAKDSDVLAKAVMGDKQVTGVEPMQEYTMLANAKPNLSFNDLTTDVNNLVKVRYRYDNNTVLEDQATTWTLDGGQSYDPKGGTWKYSGTPVNNITPHLDAVVTPVKGTAEKIAPVTKGVSKLGYNNASALGIPSQTVMSFDNNVDKTTVNIIWDSLPANFGKTAATATLKGQLSNFPEWATVDKEITADITIVDAEILKVAGGVSVKDKVYDGTTNAELVVEESGMLLTNESGDLVEDIKADASKAVANYKTAGAGADIGITVEGVTLTSDTEGFDSSRYALDFGSVTGAISKATPEITAPTTDKATYGTALKDIVLKGGKALVGGKEYEGTFSWKNGEEIPNVENQGYTAVFTPEDANNLNSVETTVAVALDKKAVTATPDAGQAKTYGDADPALTYTLDAPLVEGNEMTGALSRVSGDTVGDYEIVPGSLSAGLNYSLTVAKGVSFKVNQKVITPVATAEDREYKAGDTDAKVTVTLPEVLAADQKEVVAINYRGKFADDAVGSPKTVTVSDIQLFGNKADNYRLTTTTVTTRAAITNVWPKISDMPTAEGMTYGQKLSDTALTGGAAVDKNNPTVSVAGHFEWAEPDKVPDAGSYSAKVKFVPDNQNNYGTATLESPVVVAVAKRDVNITPDAGQTKIYGEEDPEALTYTVAEGDLLDDGAALTGALTRESGEDAGSYAIINNDLSAGSNYNIVVAEESFAIAPKNVTITAEAADRGYISGNVDAEVTLTINGAIAGDDVKATFTSAVFEDDAVGIEKTVTVSGIALTGEKAGNYLLPEGAETATTKASISNATVEITNVPTAKNGITYGQPLSDVQLEGGKAIDTQTKTEVAGAFAWKTPDQVLTDIGDAQAAVVFTPEDMESYGKAEAKVTVSVDKKAIDVKPADGQTKVFGSSDPNSYGFEVSEETPLVGEDKLMDVLTRAEGEDAGEYAYSLTESAEANTHYTITLKDADTVKFSITKATPAAPVMPVLKDSTSDTVTLETIEVTDAVAVKAGAAVEYGIIDAENAANWQAGPVFEGLEGDTAYRFTARYAATKNTEASPESGILDVKTPVGGVVIDTPTVSGVPEGTEGISVTADKLDEAVKAGEEVTFTLTGNKAKEGSYVPYGFTINGEAVEVGKMDADTRSCEVTYTVQDADVERGSLNAEVLFTRLGNINTDDKINGIDALLIQRAAAGLGEPLSEEKAVAADVNMDGKRNGIDALLIKRFAAGLSEAL
ncbi:MBG domain-containing protein [Eubacterium limosum]|uniref:MBG domain-containing protein n=1 Tax=Eubacterium limosum TaxID=1736 RepID=UPI001062C0F7|nr:MBG domain-containing protein [Eubacterium limosum]